MIIGVVSDTHMPRMARQLPAQLVKSFRNVDLIVHLGDWVDMRVYKQLAALAPVEGVAGNNDSQEIIHKFGYQKIMQLETKRIGLVHGHLPANGFALTTPDKALLSFAGERLDAILFGHSHQPLLQVQENGLLLFNPGSPTDKRRAPSYSFGLLEIKAGKIHAKHVYMDNKN